MSTKEVRFDIYCQKCKNANTPETEDPCNDCLAQGWNAESKKPILFKEKEEK